ncbi:3'(2'),5'-bisphosphate nucleotidase CysQ [Pseudoteredinibacter isoporae]|uniref:3'(2'),5'-bisphosphate nucleotidase CysQ n=1 Tax=Pseudoteredinibacter isoporae TaxID=570281 RepID=A0A7X0MUF3_9GAMM|nr:3'(2'),5'-bisphosphate nucleotidase CysQ [Pseudoteredinibacter isoporae]MBB6520561.1 3'(2'), 5'-bisphosphate nucleotidase [Pseudoteredinibacter isoporae]NHO86128.1 3'(2'),5'-bisphosphate nucleotidase CysQ [Pseudoteredinibacter isoporae]NIB25421.1 3'(2'),5'-bisphosphate nucleotidase CysQ [Pseudoteredinibacter isoporae]
MSLHPPSLSRADLCERLLEIGRAAGEAILEIYQQQGNIDVQHKSDDSPVTQADLAAHKVICQGLTELSPDIPVLSEEAHMPSFEERQSWPYYWLIDPLDGTKEFIRRNDEFTVNIALIHQHRAILGLVHTPVLDISYLGHQLGEKPLALKYHRGASGNLTEEPIQASRQSSGQSLSVVGSRRHGAEALDALLTRLKPYFGDYELQSMGSSLKLCLIAEGRAQLYPRLAPTCEWDTAAAQAVVEAAGGQVLNPEFKPLSYNQKDSLLNPNFYVVGDSSLDWASLLQD